jgi:hypothetical protein
MGTIILGRGHTFNGRDRLWAKNVGTSSACQKLAIETIDYEKHGVVRHLAFRRDHGSSTSEEEQSYNGLRPHSNWTNSFPFMSMTANGELT